MPVIVQSLRVKEQGRYFCTCSGGVLSRETILAKWLRHFNDLLSLFENLIDDGIHIR
jgi:hypothetical protein